MNNITKLKALGLILIGFVSTAFGQMTPTATVNIPMRDGKSLAADIYIPTTCSSCPTILIQTPYNKNAFRNGLPLGVLQNLQSSPYAWAVVDWRGFWGSSAAAVSQPNRGQDGYDVIDWVVSQTWSDGQVGTWGPSALGVIQYQTAKEKHAGHICAVPIVAHPQSHYEGYFYGGVLEKSRLQQLDALGYGLSPTILANTYYNTIWQFSENITWYPQDITIPTLQIGGWYDHNIDKMMDWYTATRTSADINARDEQWLLIGPWVHGGTGAAYVGSAAQGELSYPDAAFKSDSMAVDFFAYHLLNTSNNWQNTSKITYYELGHNRWNTSNATGIENVNTEDLFLKEAGQLSGQTGAGSTSFVSDPRNPSPTLGGHTLSAGLDQGPYNQVTLESRSDVITFTSDLLADDISISGRVRANLFIEANQPDADIVVRLVDVYPDGRNMLINDGTRRMRFRNGYTQADESFMSPGNVYPVEVKLPFVNYTWKTGHRIKVYISGNNATRWDVNLQNGGTMYASGDTNVANLTVHHNTTYPSKIIFPGNNPTLSSTDNHLNKRVSLYPNPAGELIQLDSEIQFIFFEIYDANGRLVSKNSLSGNKIDVASLKGGFYFIRLLNDAEVRVMPFIKE